MAADPGWRYDLALTRPERLSELLAAAQEAFPESGAASTLSVGEETLQVLQSLGYRE